jgi:hypothetical protein
MTWKLGFSITLILWLIAASVSFNSCNTTDVSLDAKKLTLVKHRVVQLTATDTPKKNVIWRSDNEAVACVDKEGNVGAIDTGVANIIATIAGSGEADTFVVTVKAPPYRSEERVYYSPSDIYDQFLILKPVIFCDLEALYDKNSTVYTAEERALIKAFLPYLEKKTIEHYEYEYPGKVEYLEDGSIYSYSPFYTGSVGYRDNDEKGIGKIYWGDLNGDSVDDAIITIFFSAGNSCTIDNAILVKKAGEYKFVRWFGSGYCKAWHKADKEGKVWDTTIDGIDYYGKLYCIDGETFVEQYDKKKIEYAFVIDITAIKDGLIHCSIYFDPIHYYNMHHEYCLKLNGKKLDVIYSELVVDKSEQTEKE